MNTTKTRKVMDVLMRVFGLNMFSRLYIGVDPLPKALKTLFSMIAQHSIILMFLSLGFVITNNMDNVLREASVLVNIAIIPLFTVLLVSFLLGGYVIAYYYNKWITKRLQIDIEM